MSGKTSTAPNSKPKPKPKRKHRIKFKLPLHKGQRQVGRHQARFKVVACGRQWGKTRLGCPLAIREAAQGKWGWWVAPDFPLAMVAWRILKMLARQFGSLAEIKEAEKRIEFASGGWLEVKSAHTDASLRSATLDFIVMDEAAFTAEKRWTSELRATLAVRKGWALFLSTFDGENWFYELYERGRSEKHPDWMSWRHRSIDNPYIDEEEVEEARRTLPKAEFEQEYEANPLTYVGAVFSGPHLQAAQDRGGKVSWNPALTTEAGLDWGHNTTAFEVCQEDAEERVHWIDEQVWHAVELNERCAAIVERCRERAVGVIYADAAGASENGTLAYHLALADLPTVVQPVPFGKYKEDGITVRRYYLERGLEAIGPNCPELIRDSKRYRYKEGTDDVVKEDDHTVDAATAWYASRRGVLVGLKRSA